MKHLFLPTLLIAASIMSCSKDELSTENLSNYDNINRISFDVATTNSTKGTVQSATTLQSTANVILSYYDDEGSTDTIIFDYVDSTTGWVQVSSSDYTTALADSDALLWSEISYPIQFYSMNHGGDAENADNPLDSYDDATAATSYSVTSSDITDHKDLLYMSKTITAMPSAGKVYGVFDHALSKVELTLSTKDASSTGYSVMLLSAKLRNPFNDGTGTITASSSTIAWSNHSGVQDSYDYFEMSEEKSYSSVMNSKIEESDTTDPEWNMMLIPQTLKEGYSILTGFDDSTADSYVAPGSWTATSLETAMKGVPYIDVLYRMEDSLGEDVVGYSDASDYLNSFTATDDITQATIDGWITTYGGEPLYIRVGFAFSTAYDILPSTYYQMDLDFFSHGGIITDDYFYDETGARTEIPIPSAILPGESVIPDASTTQIGLFVTSLDWGDATSTTVK